ncbi:hypothetical protein ILFOPFJJ_01491 [Ensifer psoraleae]|nr:hypothetical protein [Sinorhizobium psoraleae]
MAWAVFHEPFEYDRRPLQAVAFSISTGGPQQWPRDVVDAAVVAGKATEVRPPPKRQPKSTKTPAA